MTKAKLVARIKELRKNGVSFRKIEARMPRALGLSEPGNGTKAFRLFEAATAEKPGMMRGLRTASR